MAVVAVMHVVPDLARRVLDGDRQEGALALQCNGGRVV